MTRDLIGRARRLVIVGGFAPPIVYAVYEAWWQTRGGEVNVLQLGGLTVIFWLVALALVLATRRHPGKWLYPGQVGALVLLWLFFHLEGNPREPVLYWTTTIATIVVVAAVAVLPPLRGRKQVLADLPPEVIASDLVISFTPRGDSSVNLWVDQKKVTAFEETRSSDRLSVSVPLAEITEVTTWTAAEDTEWVVPGGDRTVSWPAGELIGFSTPDRRLVVAVEEAGKAKRFVEGRVALARERATIGDG
jgi:hypothetical protein